MKKCVKCGINLDTTRNTCPLCLNILEDNNEKSKESYPKRIEERVTKHILRKVFLFISFLAMFVCAVINILTYRENPTLWSLIVFTAVLYLWILIKGVILSRRNIAFMLIMQSVSLCVLLYFIEYVAKGSFINYDYDSWVIPYVVPFVMMVSIFAITLLTLIKRMRYSDYMLYLLVLSLMGFIPLILLLLRTTKGLFENITWPTIVLACYAFTTLIGLFVFSDKQAKDEFKKRFHI